MKFAPLLLLGLTVGAFAAERLTFNVTDVSGKPVANAQVVAVLKSGAHQDASFANGVYVCEAPEACVKVFVAAPGHEGISKKYAGAPGDFPVALKPSADKDSVILKGRSQVPALGGELGIRMEPSKEVRAFAWKIALLDNRGKPMTDSFPHSPNRPIDGQAGTGGKFKLWVVDVTPQVCVIEFTHPK